MKAWPWLLAGLCTALSAPALAADARAQLDALNAALLRQDSATAVLQDWCDRYGPGGLRITAERVRGPDKAPTAAAQGALLLKPGQAVGYRRVRLACGTTVLSEADNWYLPDRLTPEMNRVLDSSDTPFGVAVKALDFRRRHLSSEVLYRGGAPIPPDVLRQTGVLTTPDGAPFSFVVETYAGAAITPR